VYKGHFSEIYSWEKSWKSAEIVKKCNSAPPHFTRTKIVLVLTCFLMCKVLSVCQLLFYFIYLFIARLFASMPACLPACLPLFAYSQKT